MSVFLVYLCKWIRHEADGDRKSRYICRQRSIFSFARQWSAQLVRGRSLFYATVALNARFITLFPPIPSGENVSRIRREDVVFFYLGCRCFCIGGCFSYRLRSLRSLRIDDGFIMVHRRVHLRLVSPRSVSAHDAGRVSSLRGPNSRKKCERNPFGFSAMIRPRPPFCSAVTFLLYAQGRLSCLRLRL